MFVDRLQYATVTGIQIDVELRNRVTVVAGDSATGKSFLYQMLKKQRNYDRSCDRDTIYSNMVFMSQSDGDKIEDILECTNRFIIIDNGDILLGEHHEIGEIITGDYTNQYLIFARGFVGIQVPPNCYAYMVRDKNRIFLEYVKNKEW